MRYAALIGLLAGCAVATEPAPPVQITFIGDSITAELGELETLFGSEARTWVNAGIGGDMISGVLGRMDRDVPSTSKACVVLIGINDILGGAGDGGLFEDITPPGNIHGSAGGQIALIIQDLTARGIQPVIGTVLPVAADYAQATILNDKIRILNAWIRQYAADNNVPLVDYYAVFVGPDLTARPELVRDGLHPNQTGQALMAANVQTVLHSAHIVP